MRSRSLTAARLTAGLTALCLMAACQTQAEPVYEVVPHKAADVPVSVVVALETTEPDGPVTNQWGGITPEAKPTKPVENGSLGEIE